DENGGTTWPHDRALANTRFRYSSSPSTPPARQTATGSRRSRVSVPAAATTATAPAPAQNQSLPMKRGYSETEAARVATAAASVRRGLAIGQPPRRGGGAGQRRRSGRVQLLPRGGQPCR